MRAILVGAVVLAGCVAAGCGLARENKLGVRPGCSSCHGSAASPAPPRDLLGQSDPTARGVGAHQSHLSGGSLAGPVPCSSCHVVPETRDAPGHLDAPWPAPVTFSGLATADGAQPTLVAEPGTGRARDDSRLLVSCAGVYCHGATLVGGTESIPAWNRPDPKFTACDACHGAPPPPPHPAASQCSTCHAETVGAGLTITHPEKHIDGIVEVSAAACSSCHGRAQNPAPPVDTRGRSDTTLPSVGAHQSHLNALLSSPVACGECHTVPTSVSSPGHIDGLVQLVFGPLARTGGASPGFSTSANTCSGAYCHGATLGGGSDTSPLWTRVDGSQKACGTCHGIPPPTGRHPSVFGDHSFMGQNCTVCHADVTNPAGSAISNRALHIDGNVAVKPQGGTWNAADKTCSPGCHDPESW